jgi:hypothetical protein
MRCAFSVVGQVGPLRQLAPQMVDELPGDDMGNVRKQRVGA